jgi:hypothetical protein
MDILGAVLSAIEERSSVQPVESRGTTQTDREFCAASRQWRYSTERQRVLCSQSTVAVQHRQATALKNTTENNVYWQIDTWLGFINICIKLCI